MAESLVFAFDGPVTEMYRGYVRRIPVENGDWRGGRLHFWALARSMPVPVLMRLQYTAWQDDWTRASYSGHEATVGLPVTWSAAVDTMPGVVDWSRARQSHGVVIQNQASKPVSDYNFWDWNGEDPAAWYPLDLRFLAVFVPAGETFGGWEAYEPMSENQLWMDYALPEGCEIVTRLNSPSQMTLEVYGSGPSPFPDLPVDAVVEVPLTLSLRVNADGSVTILAVS